jgi:hypothetical protein
LSYTKSGVYLPPLPQRRPWRGEGRAKRMSVMMGLSAIVNPDGTVERQDDEWLYNVLVDAGEAAMLAVFLREENTAANGWSGNKYLALLGGAAPAETQGTITGEMTTPGTNGYNRQQVLASEWSVPALSGGDHQSSAAEKTFGPISTANQTATQAALVQAATGAATQWAYIALSGSSTILVNQSFKFIFRWTQQ